MPDPRFLASFKDQNRNQVALCLKMSHFQAFSLFLPRFSKNAVQRPREAYFINRHTTFCKEQTFNFPEYQKILKSIKNSSQKMKKSETFPKISDILKNRKFWKFRKISKNFEKIEKTEISKISKNLDFFQRNFSGKKSKISKMSKNGFSLDFL